MASRKQQRELIAAAAQVLGPFGWKVTLTFLGSGHHQLCATRLGHSDQHHTFPGSPKVHEDQLRYARQWAQRILRNGA